MSPDEPIKGLLVDLDGVIYVDEQLIAGANEALNQIRELGIPIKFITNTTTRATSWLTSLKPSASTPIEARSSRR